MFGNATKEDLVMVLCEMGETVDSDLRIMELKHKLMLSKVYLEDKEFVCDVLAAMIEDRMEKEEYRKREEKVEECHLERKQELARIEARQKKENETRMAEVGASVEEEAKAVEERCKVEEE
ncbi:hypothetical protein TNIN_85681 [Trichonephila inaurata madagascariensis]|uniref:Uncharacterized protein n=1 Tax=Trichonephila inaurata madagascariensis TaxID=2747483 RepID=A0A8X6KBB9_9ARAC|nr:hypothetical protein TNIN_85681 [Trichonephila inaurata madagascariensis]